MSSKLKITRDLLKSCLLPELKQDLDDMPMQNEQFAEFHKALETQLPLLYDVLQQQEQVVVSEDTAESQEVRACLLVLLCEIAARHPQPIYKLTSDGLLRNAEKLLERHSQAEVAVDRIIFTYYQSKLHKNCWKRQLGAVHGFLRFLDFRYNEANPDGSYKMSHHWLTFCLSVGLCVRECHEPTYKQIGTRIFLQMLCNAYIEDIQKLNIHSVIYDAVFKDVHYMNSVVATEDIWNCLLKCLDFYSEMDSLSWNYADDMIEALLRNITLAPDSIISVCLLKYIRKLCAFFTLNRHEIETKCGGDLSQHAALTECRMLCAANSSYTSFRWAKTILNTFIQESYKLMQSPNVCRQLLEELHRSYMVCVLPIDLSIIEPHLIAFYEKFTPVLMQVLVVQKRHCNITQLVRSVIETFYLQLQRSVHGAQSTSLLKFKIAFEKLLQHLNICTK